MADTDDADGIAFQTDGLPGRQAVERRKDILHDSAGIAPRSISDSNAMRIAIRKIYVVRPDGRRSDELHPRTIQQRSIAFRPGPDYQRISITDIIRTDVAATHIFHLRIRFENSFQKWNRAIRDNLDFLLHFPNRTI